MEQFLKKYSKWYHWLECEQTISKSQIKSGDQDLSSPITPPYVISRKDDIIQAFFANGLLNF